MTKFKNTDILSTKKTSKDAEEEAMHWWGKWSEATTSGRSGLSNNLPTPPLGHILE